MCSIGKVYSAPDSAGFGPATRKPGGECVIRIRSLVVELPMTMAAYNASNQRDVWQTTLTETILCSRFVVST